MKQKYLILELLLLFVFLPLILATSLPLVAKLILVLSGLVYLLAIAIKQKYFKRDAASALRFKMGIKGLGLKLLMVVLATSLIMYFMQADGFFAVVKKKPLMWLGISLVYVMFSVFPQEFLYRVYFFERYQSLFQTKKLMVFVNALVFCMAHVMFMNLFVLLLTFIGGVLFALTYYKSKSFWAVSLEHGLYGWWIFTLGMGEMLAFPMPN